MTPRHHKMQKQTRRSMNHAKLTGQRNHSKPASPSKIMTYWSHMMWPTSMRQRNNYDDLIKQNHRYALHNNHMRYNLYARSTHHRLKTNKKWPLALQQRSEPYISSQLGIGKARSSSLLTGRQVWCWWCPSHLKHKRVSSCLFTDRHSKSPE